MRLHRKRRALVGSAILFVLTAPFWLDAQDHRQDTTFRVPVRLVTIPTLVLSRRGKSITGLKGNSFHLFDNGRSQAITVEDESQRSSIVLAVQMNSEVREYLPQIARTGSLIEESLLAGDNTQVAVLSYNDSVSLRKSFNHGDLTLSLQHLSPDGSKSRMFDAGLQALDLLKQESPSQLRVIIFVGQSFDRGSDGSLESLKSRAENEGVSIFALALPIFGKSFISDTFTLGESNNTPGKGGFKAGVELTTLIPALRHSDQSNKGTDPFSVLTAASGGTQRAWRKQSQLEDALIAMGTDLRSFYFLSYIPDSAQIGHHDVKVKVDIPGATVRSRSGYERQ